VIGGIQIKTLRIKKQREFKQGDKGKKRDIYDKFSREG
jgi:hypothetical protein